MNRIHLFLIKIRSQVLVYLTHNLALPFLKYVRKPEIFPYTASQLLSFPAGTLGNDLIIYLQERKLKLLPYYARHDIKHILLDYDTTDKGEVCLQCFMLGNRHTSFPVIATVLYGIFTMPEYFSAFREAFARGKRCNSISGFKWFEILYCYTSDIKNFIK
jgi:hypothetical protein